MFPWHRIPEILYAESIDIELIIRANIFLYDPTLIQETKVPRNESSTYGTFVPDINWLSEDLFFHRTVLDWNCLPED